MLFAVLVGACRARSPACIALGPAEPRAAACAPRADRGACSARRCRAERRSSTRCAQELWNLIRGAAPLASPPRDELARRYVELLSENLGQPGFRELLIAVHDMDARRDLVFALLGAEHRARFFGRPGNDPPTRRAEAFDLAGVGARSRARCACRRRSRSRSRREPHLITFAAEGPWRGETHRLCDRPGALVRLLEEVAAAGAEQVILVSPSPPQGRPHELEPGARRHARSRRRAARPRSRAPAFATCSSTSTGRFAGLFVIRPVAQPARPARFRRRLRRALRSHPHARASWSIAATRTRYRQFIEPVVGGQRRAHRDGPAAEASRRPAVRIH